MRRLDLDDTQLRLAKEDRVPLVVSWDTHSVSQLDHLRHGVDQARRGWLEAKDVLNCLPLKEPRRWLES